ncbi:MAG: DeoR/GlpR family DNA-binding transcription regulator [Acidimicrobiales bacterium]
MNQAVRLGEILDALQANGSVQVTALADLFGVSQLTIRRDLDLLANQKLLVRTHGGAIAHAGLLELPLRYKEIRHRDAKRAIAARVVNQLKVGAVVGLTGGTTTTEVARALVDLQSCTVVTNALNIAAELAVRASIKLILTGGTCRPQSYELVGPLAEVTLSQLHIDVCFVGADGCSPLSGLTTHDDVEAHTNRALIQRSARTIAVVDSSKLGRTSFAQICDIGTVDQVVTDDRADPLIVAEFERLGTSVSVVDL